jgi:hypothetical protein
MIVAIVMVVAIVMMQVAMMMLMNPAAGGGVKLVDYCRDVLCKSRVRQIKDSCER